MARQGVVGIEELIMNKVATLRRWKKTKLFKKQSRWDFTFKVMTYNILSQAALHCHMYLYRKCNPAFLTEDYRASKILPEILRSESDIICLQEVEQDLYDFSIKSYFETNGFASIFKRRPGGKTDGCAILWRRSKFNLTDHCDVEFRSNSSKLLDRDNIGLIAVLRPKHPKSRDVLLHVATTHLLFNPRRGDIKLCQLRWLLAELERMSLKKVTQESRTYHPTILCGDFNFEPNSPLYQFVETGRIDVVNTNSGNLSGQADGRDRGRMVDKCSLELHKLGISDSSRFELGPRSASTQNQVPNSSLQTSTRNQVPNSGRFESGPQSSSSRFESKSETSTPSQVPNSPARSSKESTPPPLSPKTCSGSSRSPICLDESSNSSDDVPKTFYHDFLFVPVYKFYSECNRDDVVTSVVGSELNRVDHMFYNVKRKKDTRSFDEGYLRLLSVFSLMFADDIKELGGLPNAAMGSDHLPLIAMFGFNFHR